MDANLAQLTVRLSRAAYLDQPDAATAVADLGLGGFRFFDASSTQAFVASDASRVFLAFRGTESDNPRDWVRDSQFATTKGELETMVHSGFHKALDEVWTDMRPLATGGEVFLTGHSLGAGIATLAAARLADDGATVAGVYTYGQPRTGKADFAGAYQAALGSKTFRFVNHIDVVTRVPFLLQGYRHVGQRMYFDGDGAFHDGASVWKVAWDDIKARLRHFGTIKAAGVGPHDMSKYVARVDALAGEAG
ncbi:MAG: lipase family protein [Acidimicrobiia bacterium]